MRSTFQLLFLFFVFSLHSYGQGSTLQIKSKWEQVTSLLQKRSNIINSLTKTLSTSNVDKKQNNNLKSLAIDLYNYVGSVSLVDSVSISIVAAKNNKLWKSLLVTLIEIENHQEIKSKRKFATVQGELEGCENRIKNAIRDYNDICRKYNKTDLIFLSDYQSKPTEVQF